MMEDRKFVKGDIVRVWNLQSFYGGGFLDGVRAVVRQTQTGDSSITSGSVILSVVRNINGVYKIDESYEVYARQCELVEGAKPIIDRQREAQEEILFGEYFRKLMENEAIR